MATDLDVSLPFDGQDAFESEWQAMFGSWLADFICLTNDFHFAVFADSTGRQVKVRTGKCNLGGVYGSNAAEKTVPVGTNTSGNPRIDRVVLRLDYAAQKIQVDVKAGTPGSSPAPPTLTQNSTVREVSLAQVGPLSSGFTTIAAGSVTDERFLWSPATIPLYASTGARDLWNPSPPIGAAAMTLSSGGQFYLYDGAWQPQRRKRNSKGYTPAGNEATGTNATWPVGLTRSVDIPAWATVARVNAKLGQIIWLGTGPSNVQVDIRIGTLIGAGQRVRLDANAPREDLVLIDDIDVSSVAGTTLTLRTFANVVSDAGNVLVATPESVCLLEVDFTGS